MSKDLYKNEISQLTKQVSLQNSLVHRFKIGVVQGVGSALGATIVASLLLLLLAQIVAKAETIPFFNNFIKNLNTDYLVAE